MFPTIFALGLKGLGPNTKVGGSLLVMAIVGGAVLTTIDGTDLGEIGQPRARICSSSLGLHFHRVVCLPRCKTIKYVI